MRIVGVIDVRDGCAVHARGGRRDAYAPVGVAAGERVDGDAAALARVYVDVLGVRELYLADLDAIEHGIGAMNTSVVEHVAALGVPVWMDAGVSTTVAAGRVLDAGASMVIVGLETLTSFGALADICASAGTQQVAFSIDLRNGDPIAPPNVLYSTRSVAEIAEQGATAGVGSILVLDVARVGRGVGVDVDLMARVRREVPGVALFAGGGVRASDLDVLAAVGCDGALVATALLSGALRPA